MGASWNHFRFWKSKKWVKWENKQVKTHGIWEETRQGCYEFERWKIVVMSKK